MKSIRIFLTLWCKKYFQNSLWSRLVNFWNSYYLNPRFPSSLWLDRNQNKKYTTGKMTVGEGPIDEDAPRRRVVKFHSEDKQAAPMIIWPGLSQRETVRNHSYQPLSAGSSCARDGTPCSAAPMCECDRAAAAASHHVKLRLWLQTGRPTADPPPHQEITPTRRDIGSSRMTALPY